MLKYALKGNIILPDRVLTAGVVLVEGEEIADVLSQGERLPEKEADFRDFGQKLISPGLIDIHLHGAAGKDVMDCDLESLEQIALHQARCGVTGFLGTSVSSSLELLLRAIKSIRDAAQLPMPSEILGVHIEGPFLSRERKGAQDPSFIRGMSEEEVQKIIQAVRGLKTIVSIAPEVNMNEKFIKTLKENGLVVSIGHSDATYQKALESFEKGISHATHLYNAMSGYHHRDPGVVGAVFDSPGVTAEVIADGVHLHPSALRLVLARKSVDSVCLITDSIKAAGMGDGVYTMGNLEIEVKGNEARLRESGVLAGSVLTMNRAVRNVVEWTDLPLHQVINLASLNPARVLGLEDKWGSIQRGKYANFTIFNEDFEVVETILRGRTVLKKKN